MRPYTFFLAGIIQGSIAHEAVHRQDYRAAIKDIIEAHVPEARVYCPFTNHPQSLHYDNEKASRVFFDHIRMARETDCLVAYVPEASMGTAVEMYAAREARRAVIAISPLGGNWSIKFLSDRLLADVAAFEAFAASGGLAEFLEEFYREGA